VHFDHSRPRRALSRKISFVALGVMAASSTSTVAFADYHDLAMSAPLRGLVLGVGSSTMQIQTSSGTVNVGLMKGVTHVVRSVMASTGDVTVGKRVDLHLVKGTRTVDAIWVEQNKPAPVHRVEVHASLKGGTSSLHHRDAGGTGTQSLSGQVASLSGGTLTLRYRNGSTASFTLAPNVHVNEALLGSLADLGIGETVQVFLGRPGNVARSIVIINA
jgi:hypothetical protein